MPVVDQWIGISFDEVIRMKPSFEDWQVNRFPLMEHAMTRQDCLRWLKRHGYPLPPRAAASAARSIRMTCGGAFAITTRWAGTRQ